MVVNVNAMGAIVDAEADHGPGQDNGCDVDWAKQLPHCFWRKQEAKDMVRNGDSKSVGRLRTFGFLGKTYYPEQAETPLGESWNFHPEDIRKETCGLVAGHLLRQSSALIERIPFEAMVQQALGRYFPELKALFWEYEWLNVRLYSYYLRWYKSRENLVRIKRNAYECVDKRTLKDPDLKTPLCRFITEPLDKHFQKPQPAEVILHQAEVLRRRFSRYITGLDDKWSKPLDTCTDFMDDFQSLGPSTLAKALTKMDHALYRKLDNDSFKKDEQALKIIKRRSNNLTLSVQDCLDAQILSMSEILQLVQELCSLRNYYSVDAVSKGVKGSGFSTQVVQQLDSLFNLAQELRSNTPALLPVFQNAAYRGDTGLAESCISRCASYSIEVYTSAEDKTLSCESMEIADTTEFSGLKSEDTTLASSNTALKSACLRHEDPDPQFWRDEKMEYCPPTPAKHLKKFVVFPAQLL
ncbi:hypothetical protein N7486_008069 [Penicillium sp. IBT 16267x]|nr:hypothetical protein N7486_008069 [Penicillium sp. IBT 16267x]